MQFTLASVLLTGVMVMYAQNAAMRAANMWHLPADPLVQVLTSLDSVDVDPDLLAAELLRAPQIKGVTGVSVNQRAVGDEPDAYSRSPSNVEIPVHIQSKYISYDFFSTLGVDLMAGRSFARGRDLVSSAARGTGIGQTGTLAIVVDIESVHLLGWSTAQEAIGQVVYQHSDIEGATTGTRALEIIGVVERAPLTFLTIGTKANAYHLDPYRTQPIIRLAADDVQGGMAHIERVWADLTGSSGDSTESATRLIFLDDALQQALQVMNALTTALLTVVTFGFLVALAGIFGMALFVANRRRHEIGIRKALGADWTRILRQLLVEFGKPVLIGNLIAWPIGYLLATAYMNWFAERMSFTPWPFVLSLAVTLGLAWLGVGGPVLKAARLVPAQILRDE